MTSRPTPTAPWQPDPVIDWLLDEGRLIPEAAELTAALGTRLSEQGAALQRMRISLRTLNPLVVGSAFTWWRDRPEVECFSPPHSIIQSPDYLGSPIEAVQHSGQPFHCRVAEAPMDSLHASLEELRHLGTTDYLALPLRFNHDPVPGAWILNTDHPEGFSQSDLKSFERLARALAPVIEVQALKMTTRSLLDTYLGPRTGRRVFAGQIRRGDGEQIEAAIWYSDMRHSTAITESLPLAQVLELLNRYFQVISDAVRAEGGEVMRFVGDALLVVFATEPDRPLAATCEAALRAAGTAADAMASANREFEAQGLPAVHYGLGLDVGQVIYGNVGAPDRLDFTVMGAAVNRAARIERLTKEANRSVLASEPFARQLTTPLAYAGAYPVAGMREPLRVYALP